jgi:hypothetical protein
MINNPNNPTNNILAYFIKDIKDAKEQAFYKQINNTNNFIILYKDKKIYEYGPLFISNYLYNILKSVKVNYMFNNKIRYNYRARYKNLFYKKDGHIHIYNPNYITIQFYQDKYLQKYNLNYVNEAQHLLTINIKYYNLYKYIYKIWYIKLYNTANNYITSPMILIPNKYELQYYSKLLLIF